ncbi:hypothetical protein B6E66_34940 [Streptomyces maremycinicus]|uniref:hypothetical protein n=1 Tax=Streptomyces maremycinicus TaxID=1679753 RepID=UPI0007889C1B|nr:hypothetical protein [Streptomyces sp. NBRC 110468]OQR59446.1 hypothetical protein B6E66_34940 [Streptomyces sp. B9173]
MNLSTRTTVLFVVASALLITVMGTARAATLGSAPRDATAHATVDGPAGETGDEPEDVELNEAGRPDLDED